MGWRRRVGREISMNEAPDKGDKKEITCILDASVMLDLIVGEIESCLLSCPCMFITSDIIADEEINRSYTRTQLQELGISINELEPDELIRIMEIMERHPELSPKDLSAYLFSVKYGGILISGDGALRTFAEAHQITCHGTLWLLDHLVNRRLLVPPEGANALERMLKGKRWLPRAECEMRIQVWRRRLR